jgi:hypothetical protein
MNPNMPVAVFEIKEYMVILRQNEERVFGGVNTKIRGVVRCSGTGQQPKPGEDYRLEIFFLAPDSAFPEPQIDLAGNNGQMFFPISDLMTVVDILRYEKPIYGHLRGDRPSWTSITTTNEPVGEGSSDVS